MSEIVVEWRTAVNRKNATPVPVFNNLNFVTVGSVLCRTFVREVNVTNRFKKTMTSAFS